MGRLVAWTVLGFAACLLACASSLGNRADEVKDGLLGMRGVQLNMCLGAPDEIVARSDSEYLAYRWSLYPAPDERVSIDKSWPPSDGVGYCALVFELQDRKVSRVAAQGRTPSGLNWDARCAMIASRCLPS